MRVLMPLAGFALAATTALGYPALAQETTDKGTLDPGGGRGSLPEAWLLPLRRQYIPDPSALRRHASAHVAVVRRDRLRQLPRTGGSLSLRARRRSDLLDRSARAAEPPARFSGRRRSRREHGYDGRNQGRKPGLDERPGTEALEPDAGRRRRAGDAASTTKSWRASAARASLCRTALRSEEIIRSIWQKNVQAAEENNDPGTFTALIGYEWSSNTGGNNLHRVVIFRDGAEKTEQILPFSSLQSDNPEDLWKALAELRDEDRRQRARHSSQRQSVERLDVPAGQSRSEDSRSPRSMRAPARAWSRSWKSTQMKGDGETHPFLSPNDEFADFERWDDGNLDLSVAKTPEMLEFEYARSALKNGLKLEARAWREPVQIRHDRSRRTPTPRSPQSKRTTSSASCLITNRAPSALRTRSPSSATRWSWAGK